jgi:hypothetical protein
VRAFSVALSRFLPSRAEGALFCGGCKAKPGRSLSLSLGTARSGHPACASSFQPLPAASFAAPARLVRLAALPTPTVSPRGPRGHCGACPVAVSAPGCRVASVSGAAAGAGAAAGKGAASFVTAASAGGIAAMRAKTAGCRSSSSHWDWHCWFVWSGRLLSSRLSGSLSRSTGALHWCGSLLCAQGSTRVLLSGARPGALLFITHALLLRAPGVQWRCIRAGLCPSPSVPILALLSSRSRPPWLFPFYRSLRCALWHLTDPAGQTLAGLT